MIHLLNALTSPLSTSGGHRESCAVYAESICFRDDAGAVTAVRAGRVPRLSAEFDRDRKAFFWDLGVPGAELGAEPGAEPGADAEVSAELDRDRKEPVSAELDRDRKLPKLAVSAEFDRDRNGSKWAVGEPGFELVTLELELAEPCES